MFLFSFVILVLCLFIYLFPSLNIYNTLSEFRKVIKQEMLYYTAQYESLLSILLDHTHSLMQTSQSTSLINGVLFRIILPLFQTSYNEEDTMQYLSQTVWCNLTEICLLFLASRLITLMFNCWIMSWDIVLQQMKLKSQILFTETTTVTFPLLLNSMAFNFRRNCLH